MVKRRLYRLCRTLSTNNWPYYLKDVVSAINNSPNAAIGYLKPSEIQSPIDDPKIDAVLGIPEDISFQEQMENQTEYEGIKRNLQVEDYVYLDFNPKTMDKGFDTPVKSGFYFGCKIVTLSGFYRITNYIK